jgi:hypothetical protein
MRVDWMVDRARLPTCRFSTVQAMLEAISSGALRSDLELMRRHANPALAAVESLLGMRGWTRTDADADCQPCNQYDAISRAELSPGFVQCVARDDQLDECAHRVCVYIQAHRSSHAHTQTRNHIYTDMMTDDIVRCKRTSICAAQAIVRYVLNSPSELIAAKYLGEIALRHALRRRCGTAQNRNPKPNPIGSDVLRHIWYTIKRSGLVPYVARDVLFCAMAVEEKKLRLSLSHSYSVHRRV